MPVGSYRERRETIQEVRKTAKQLTVFQRMPNWCSPLLNRSITAEEQRDIRHRYPELFECRRSGVIAPMRNSPPSPATEIFE